MDDDTWWCKTEWENCRTLVSAVDHVYVGLQLNSDTTEYISLNLLQQKDVRDIFLRSLDNGNFLSLETNLQTTYWPYYNQRKILMLMIDNMSTFASYRMDTILVPFIGVLWESHATTVALAQEALLKWTEWHHFHLLDKETRTIIEKTLELGDGAQRKSFSTSNCNGDRKRMSQLQTLEEDEREVAFKIHRVDDHFGDDGANQSISTVPSSFDKSVAAENESSLLSGEFQGFSSERMGVIISSLQHIAWLDSITDDDSSSPPVHARIEFDMNSICGESFLPEEGELRVTIELVTASMQPATSALSSQSARKSELEVTSERETDGTVKGQHVLDHTENNIVANKNAIPSNPGREPTKEDNSSHDIAHRGNDSILAQLLLSCRAHRVHVQKVASTAKSGALAPKLIQQLCQSACSHLIRISSLEYVPKGGEKSTPHPSQTQYSTLSQPDDAAECASKYALHTLIQQVYALLGLGLHLAPDEVVAAVSDVLLTQVEEKNKQPQWQRGENAQAFAAVLFLSGVLLPRVRALTAPASRLLFRALEITVKKAPDLAVSLVLPLMIKHTHYSPLSSAMQPNQPQHEMLLRMARQAVCKDLLDEVVYNLCLDGEKGQRDSHDPGSPSQLVLATGITLDALLSSAINTDLSKSHTGATHEHPAGTATSKKGNKDKTVDSASNTGYLSTSEQDRFYSNWMDSVSSALFCSTESDVHQSTVWCNQIGLVVADDGKGDPDPERLKSINTILNLMVTVTLKTSRAVMDLLATTSTAAIPSSGASTISTASLMHAKANENLAARRSHSLAAIVAIIYTLATRFPKITGDGLLGLKIDAVSILSRCGTSAVGKAALIALNKLP